MKSQRRTAYRYIVMLASFLSKVSEEIASENAENCRSRQPHYCLTPLPRKLTPANIRISNYISSGLQKMHLFCNRVRIGRSRSSKVVDFGTNRKGVCDFLLIINSNLGPILHRFWHIATCWQWIFSTPLIYRPRLGWILSNFWMNFLSPRLESQRCPMVKLSLS